MTTTLAHWTIADYHQMIETGLLVDRRVELLNGLIVEMSPESPDHADLSNDLLEQFMSLGKGRYRVRPAKPITIPKSNSEPEPDIALVQAKSYRDSHPLPKEIYLIVEFANSSLGKDTQEKRKTYAQCGISDYWVVNLRDQSLLVYRNPIDGDYTSEQQLTTGVISPLDFPDIVIEVPRLLT